MAWEPREGTGSLFRNEKQTDSQPDYRGSCMVLGNVYEVAGWIKEGKNGKFLSLSIKPKQDRPSGRQRTDDPRSKGPDRNLEDIPF